MTKTRAVLSDNKLLDYSKEHVLYEISMLVQCGQLLGSAFQSQVRAVALLFRNVVIESFAIHLRNLIDFLYPSKIPNPTDVTADDFFIGRTRPANFPRISASLETARKRAHKQVSHLTTGRLAPEDPGKEWRAQELAGEILRVLARFAAEADPDKLHPCVGEYIKSCGKSACNELRTGPSLTAKV